MRKNNNSTVKSPWKQNDVNFVLGEKDEGFYISYNPNDKPDPMLELLGEMGKLLAGLSAKREPETALCKKGEFKNGPIISNRRFLILKGDWREEYEKAYPKGYEACLEVYNKHKAQYRSDWSEDDAVEVETK